MKSEIGKEQICIEVELPVAKQQTWILLTGKSHILHWWGDYVSLEAKEGGAFLEKWMKGEREVTTSGKIILFNPPSELKMTWADEDWPGETIVSFSLFENSENTRVKLVHSGWDIHPEDKRQNLVKTHADGWSAHLKRLRAYAADKPETPNFWHHKTV